MNFSHEYDAKRLWVYWKKGNVDLENDTTILDLFHRNTKHNPKSK